MGETKRSDWNLPAFKAREAQRLKEERGDCADLEVRPNLTETPDQASDYAGPCVTDVGMADASPQPFLPARPRIFPHMRAALLVVRAYGGAALLALGLGVLILVFQGHPPQHGKGQSTTERDLEQSGAGPKQRASPPAR